MDYIKIPYGMDLIIDASLSRDEKYPTSINDPHLIFSWKTTDILNNIFTAYLTASVKNKKILIKAKDYMKYVNKNTDYKFQLELSIKKDRRSAIKLIDVMIKKPIYETQIINKNKTNIEMDKINKENINDSIYIDVDKIEEEDLIIKYNILDNSINQNKFKSIWTIKNFSEDKYLNGRNEIRLRVKKDDLLIGLNKFYLELIDKNSDKYFKEFTYEKSIKPYGGSCIVTPSFGISLETNFTFIIENWISSSFPLIYSLKYSNNENILIDITNGGFFSNTYITNKIPVGYSINLYVTDIEGKYSKIPCTPKVSTNKNLPSMNEYLANTYILSNKILLMDIYETNKINAENDQDNINSKIQILNSLFDIMTDQQFLFEFNNIISQIIKLTKSNINIEKINNILNLLKMIIKKIDILIEDLIKIEKLYLIINNINSKLSEIKGKLIILFFKFI